MKDNKNLVFGLRSFKPVDTNTTPVEFSPDGYLLFPDENKAMSFLETCEVINKRGKTCHYEKFTWVKVNDYIGERINSQKQFYVQEAEAYIPTEEDFKPSSKNSKVIVNTEEVE